MFAENASWQIDKEFGEGRSAYVSPEGKSKEEDATAATTLQRSLSLGFAHLHLLKKYVIIKVRNKNLFTKILHLTYEKI